MLLLAYATPCLWVFSYAITLFRIIYLFPSIIRSLWCSSCRNCTLPFLLLIFTNLLFNPIINWRRWGFLKTSLRLSISKTQILVRLQLALFQQLHLYLTLNMLHRRAIFPRINTLDIYLVHIFQTFMNEEKWGNVIHLFWVDFATDLDVSASLELWKRRLNFLQKVLDFNVGISRVHKAFFVRFYLVHSFIFLSFAPIFGDFWSRKSY